MPGDTLIDDHVSAQHCKRAVDALLAHATKFEEDKAAHQLLPGKEPNVWLVVNTKVMQPEKKIKPARMCVFVAILFVSDKADSHAETQTCEVPNR